MTDVLLETTNKEQYCSPSGDVLPLESVEFICGLVQFSSFHQELEVVFDQLLTTGLILEEAFIVLDAGLVHTCWSILHGCGSLTFLV